MVKKSIERAKEEKAKAEEKLQQLALQNKKGFKTPEKRKVTTSSPEGK